MEGFDLIVVNGLVVTHNQTRELDIAIKDGKISKLAPRGSLTGAETKKTIDAMGGMVMVSNVLILSEKVKWADEMNSRVVLTRMCEFVI